VNRYINATGSNGLDRFEHFILFLVSGVYVCMGCAIIEGLRETSLGRDDNTERNRSSKIKLVCDFSYRVQIHLRDEEDCRGDGCQKSDDPTNCTPGPNTIYRL